ncbi:diguanylate cyclase domain-containing protein [Streptomyces sp. NPDC002730]|uniref:diguanylate cyclase domain-containing protein n=1 Tax=Streptomyces sp. NPDC002730 TaxID=3364662 RepID=UPI0036C8C4C8
MASNLRVQALIGQRTLLLTTAAALPLTGWTVHALALHRRLAAARRDPLTGLASWPELITYGHAAGDAVLSTNGRRLARWTSGRQALAVRLGGDDLLTALLEASSQFTGQVECGAATVPGHVQRRLWWTGLGHGEGRGGGDAASHRRPVGALPAG